MVRIGAFEVSLVRDGSIKTESRKGDCAAAIAAIVRAKIGKSDREKFLVLMLTARHDVIAVNVVSIGTLTASLVHPREAFKPAILAGAAAVCFAHNHPSGDCSPSLEDRDSTRRLARAGELLGIPVVDHVIISSDGFFSFKENGLL